MNVASIQNMSIEEMINTIEETYSRYSIEVESDGRATVTVISYSQLRSGRHEADSLQKALEKACRDSKPAPVRELEDRKDFLMDEWSYDGEDIIVIGKRGHTLTQNIESEKWRFAGHEKAREGREKYCFASNVSFNTHTHIDRM
jgi:hypothetical protein